MQTEIIEQIEQDAIDAQALGHSVECYETAMEIMWEQGRIDSPHDPRLFDEIRADIAEQRFECRCDTEDE